MVPTHTRQCSHCTCYLQHVIWKVRNIHIMCMSSGLAVNTEHPTSHYRTFIITGLKLNFLTLQSVKCCIRDENENAVTTIW
jgi:hypothetical protein